ncbi:MAG: neutral/alkaline non-lysosomal ceramidase N-terminal domain-containing protein [Anaerolineae bacterium]|nr:neutral/alkaline non-lysosomal ceramidase N-terminal domain-containing protein [Candidatus Roseilinea sp.]MDW8449412.1 neutral/alkaline non-lysosomal ceramidase N-terminal domain-containing protein [Anaerolineae bacterium]
MTTLTYAHAGFAGHIGVARRDITPPIGIYNRNWGAATDEVATGIHRPLTLTALALKREASDAQPLVLLSLDLGWWRTREDEWEVRSAILDALGVDERRVLLHLTHTHAGPSICREDADRPGGHLVGSYLDHVKAMCIEAAREAVQRAAPALLDWAYGKCALARNRDLTDPDADRIVCGFNPDTPADDTLLVGRATDAGGRVIATLVNYAMHPVTLAWQNALISPDFVGAMREVVEAHTRGAPCLFLQGASGELAPMEEYTGDVAVADKHGRALGFAALAVLEGMLPAGKQLRYAGVVESGAPLATWTHADATPSNSLDARMLAIEIPLKPGLSSLAEIEAQLATAHEPFMVERLRRRHRLRRAVGDGDSTTVSIWLWCMGDALLVANPNEAYSHLQIELRRRFPNRTIAVLNITNGGYAYLPPREMYARDQYQVWQTPYAAGCLERTIAACVSAVAEMTGE